MAGLSCAHPVAFWAARIGFCVEDFSGELRVRDQVQVRVRGRARVQGRDRKRICNAQAGLGSGTEAGCIGVLPRGSET